MSRTKLITLICWLVVAVVMVGLIVWFLTGRLFGIPTGFKINGPISGFSIGTLTGPFNEVGSYSVPADNIDTLDVSWTAGAAVITPYDGDSIKITEYAQRELKDNEKLVYKTSGKTLTIQYLSPGLGINMISKNLEILVPKALAAKLDKLTASATSAEISIADFTVNTLNVNETSGSADLKNITTRTADIGSVSGEITLTGVSASDINIDTTSGEMYLTNTTADSLETNSVSGDHNLSGTFKSIDSGSVSGEITIQSTVNPDKLSCHSTSGEIMVTLPGHADLSVDYNTTSGDFKSDLAVRNSDNAPYNFNTVSGDITLKAAS